MRKIKLFSQEKLFSKYSNFVQGGKEISTKIWLLVSFLGLILIIWQIPKFQTQTVTIPSGKTRFELENDARTTLIQALGGTFFFVSAYLTWKSLRTAEKTYLISEDKNLTDRFSKAVEMLASSELMVRLGGIYTLDRISKDSPEDHWPVMEVLSAFIRERSTMHEYQQITFSQNRLATDIQAAIKVVGQRSISDEAEKIINLQGSHLKWAVIEDSNFEGADLRGVDLESSHIVNSTFDWSNLSDSNFSFARIEDVSFSEAKLWRSNFSHSRLESVSFSRYDESYTRGHDREIILRLDNVGVVEANFENSVMQNVSFVMVSCNRANFSGSTSSQVFFKYATLIETDFSDAELGSLCKPIFYRTFEKGVPSKLQKYYILDTFFDGADLKDVISNENTIWPRKENFKGAKNIPECVQLKIDSYVGNS